jgi:beta-lactamase class A
MMSRRTFLTATLALPRLLTAAPERLTRLHAALEQLERTNGGRLGVAVWDTSSGQRSTYRADERFPMCSTFKFLLVSAILHRVDRHQETLYRSIAIPPMPLLFNSPLTEPHAGGVMPIAALCSAALTRSDNTAANLLLSTIGGPAGITSFARSIGDPVTRLDRTETSLNEGLAGDPRDTTSPASMVRNLQSLLLEDVLSRPSRNQLAQWMEENTTGLDRLRADLPSSWRAADKTGSNGEHTSNDIAALWPPNRQPMLIAAYITQCSGPESKRAAMLKQIGKLVRESLA